MALSLNGTTGISGIDGSASTPAGQGTDTNTGLFYGVDTVSIATNGTERVKVNSSGQTEHQAGSVSAPAITASGDLDTGVFFSAANTVDVATNGTAGMQLDSSQNLKFNSGYGSVATAYGCRAWVNFNGTSTVAIRASGGVSSITDNGGVGDYTVNFTNAMPDANYSAVASGSLSDAIAAGNSGRTIAPRSLATGSVRLIVTDGASGVDMLTMCVAIFR